jgi:hypothetical protein
MPTLHNLLPDDVQRTYVPPVGGTGGKQPGPHRGRNPARAPLALKKNIQEGYRVLGLFFNLKGYNLSYKL